MKIAGFIKESFIDYPGKMASIIFTAGCNYSCPSCHAKKIVNPENYIEESAVIDYIKKRKNFIKGLVICGGEPTKQWGLENFLEEVKQELGLPVKLDTNGSNYVKINSLIEKNLVDYIAMDVKGPLSIYRLLAGVSVDRRDGLMKGISMVSQAKDYEFRTTICPVIREKGEINFMTPEEIEETAKMIYEYSGGESNHKYFLQKFVARSKEEMIDERLAKENLPAELQETPQELLIEMQKRAVKILPNCKIR